MVLVLRTNKDKQNVKLYRYYLRKHALHLHDTFTTFNNKLLKCKLSAGELSRLGASEFL